MLIGLLKVTSDTDGSLVWRLVLPLADEMPRPTPNCIESTSIHLSYPSRLDSPLIAPSFNNIVIHYLLLDSCSRSRRHAPRGPRVVERCFRMSTSALRM